MAPSTCIRQSGRTCQVADWSCSVRSNCHKSYSTTAGRSFAEYQTSIQWDKLRGVWRTGQRAAFASRCICPRNLGICGIAQRIFGILIMRSNPEIDLVQSRDCSAHVTTRDRLSRQVLIVRAASEIDGNTRKLYKSCTIIEDT